MTPCRAAALQQAAAMTATAAAGCAALRCAVPCCVEIKIPGSTQALKLLLQNQGLSVFFEQ